MRTSGFARRVLVGMDRARRDRRARRTRHRMVPGRPTDHVRVLGPGARGRRRGRRLALAGAPDVARDRSPRRCSSALMAAGALIAWSRQRAVHRSTRGANERLPRPDRRRDCPGHAAGVHRGRRRRDGVVPGDPRGERDPRRRCRPTGSADVLHLHGHPGELPAGGPTIRGSVEYDAMSRSVPGRHPEDPERPRSRSSWRRSTGPLMPRPIRGLMRWSPRRVHDDPGTLGDERRTRAARAVVAGRQVVLAASVILCGSPASPGSAGRGGPGSICRPRSRVAPAIGVAASRSAGSRSEPLGLPLSGSVGPTVVAPCWPAGSGTSCSSCGRRGHPATVAIRR